MTTTKLRGYSASRLEGEVLERSLTFGAAVEALRSRDDLTQAEFANKLGVSKQYICDVEKGRRLVSPEQAARLAKAFGHLPHVMVELAHQDAVCAGGLDLKVRIESR